MLNIIRASLRTGRVTTAYPNVKDSGNYRGRPIIQASRCSGEDRACVETCPATAISITHSATERTWRLDLARCVFCGLCAEVCVNGAITMSHDFELATRNRDALIVTADRQSSGDVGMDHAFGHEENRTAGGHASRIGRSLHIRHMAAGSDNSCDWEIASLLNPIYDVQRLGIDFVASPRHADLLLVTGAVTRHLQPALMATYEAMPAPRIVVAAGDEACGGGLLQGSYAVAGGVDRCLPVDVYIPGDPPSPMALIDGLLLAMGRKRHHERLG